MPFCGQNQSFLIGVWWIDIELKQKTKTGKTMSIKHKANKTYQQQHQQRQRHERTTFKSIKMLTLCFVTMNLNYSVGSYCWSMDCIFYMRGACAFLILFLCFVALCLGKYRTINQQIWQSVYVFFLSVSLRFSTCMSTADNFIFHWQHYRLRIKEFEFLNAKFQCRYNDDGKTHRMTFIDNINKLLHMTAVFKFTQPIFDIGISTDAAKNSDDLFA